MPIKDGGLGLPIASRIAHSAFLGSFLDNRVLSESIAPNIPLMVDSALLCCNAVTNCFSDLPLPTHLCLMMHCSLRC